MIYLDIDGVLANFIKSAIVAHGRNPEEILRDWPRGEWDVYKVLGLESEQEFWEPIHEDDYFWDDLESYPWTRGVMREVFCADPDFVFATKPSACRNCFHGKSNWIRKNGFEPSSKLYITPDKVRMCRPGDILIDDSGENCERWADAGGRVILFPQPWNKNGHIKDPFRYMRSELRKMK